jgi:hypothetical protein
MGGTNGGAEFMVAAPLPGGGAGALVEKIMSGGNSVKEGGSSDPDGCATTEGGKGVSNSAVVGSPEDVGSFGVSETSFPQRLLIVRVPSVRSNSPFCKVSFLVVQKMRFPTR